MLILRSLPVIHMCIANKYSEQIAAIYIRNISAEKESATLEMLDAINNKNIHIYRFKQTDEAILHAKRVGG